MQTQKETRLRIRPFTADDYDVITRLFNATFAPEFEKEPSDFRFDDDHQPEYVKSARWIVEAGGTPVAFGAYTQSTHAYNPRKFQLVIAIDPEHQLKGIGRRLYDLLLAA